MPLLILAAAASFACLSPRHHDGDAIRCAGIDGSMRLHAIDAPEMPGACRPGRDCTPGDPYAARDHLRGLTRGRRVTCEQVDTDNYGRRVVECRADGANIACQMIADGFAVQRYGSPDCSGPASSRARARSPSDADWPGGEPPRRGRVDPPGKHAPAEPLPSDPQTRLPVPPPETLESRLARLPWPAILAWLLGINIVAYTAFAVDKQRAVAGRRQHGVNRVPENALLGLALAGGSIGAVAAQQRLRHKTVKQPFANILLAICGGQLGLALGIAALLVLPAL